MTHGSGPYEQMDHRKTVHAQGHEGLGRAGEKKTTFHSEFTMGRSVRARPTLASSTLARSNNCNYDYNYNHNLNKNIIYNKNYYYAYNWWNPKGERKMRAQRVGARRVGARRVGGQNFALFFPSRHNVHSFFPLSGAAGDSHDSPRTPNVHISGSRPSKTQPKFNEKTPKRGKKE